VVKKVLIHKIRVVWLMQIKFIMKKTNILLSLITLVTILISVNSFPVGKIKSAQPIHVEKRAKGALRREQPLQF
jgi:hypothetical protein